MTEGKQDSAEGKHWAFFVGLFLGIGASVPIVIYGLEYLADKVSLLVAILVVVLLLLSACFALLFLFRDRILRYIFKGASGSIENIGAAVRDYFEKSESEDSPATTIAREIGALYVWARVRFRMFTWFIALIIAIGTYIQAMLLFRQNELFDAQNKIVGSQSAFLEKQTKLQSDQGRLFEQQIELEKLQYDSEKLAIRKGITSSLTGLLAKITTDIDRIVQEQEINFTSFNPEEIETLKSLQIRTNQGSWYEILDEDTDDFWKIVSRYGPAEESLLQRVWSEYAAFQDRARILKPEFGPAYEFFLDNLLGIEDTASLYWMMRLQEEEIGNYYQLGSVRYREIAAQFEILSRSDAVDSEIYGAARGELLLALLRLKVNLAPFQFGGLDLMRCFFGGVNLKDLEFSGFDLRGSSFRHVEFVDVTFKNCDLRGVSFEQCSLRNCRFKYCILPGPSSFRDCDVDSAATFVLSVVGEERWLDEVSATNDIGTVSDQSVSVEAVSNEDGFASGQISGITGRRQFRLRPSEIGFDFQILRQRRVPLHNFSLAGLSKLEKRMPEDAMIAGQPYDEWISISMDEEDLALERARHAMGEPGSKLEFVCPTHIQISPNNLSDAKNNVNLAWFLNRIEGQVTQLHVWGVLPDDNLTIGDWKAIKSKLPDCTVRFTTPIFSIMDKK